MLLSNPLIQVSLLYFLTSRIVILLFCLLGFTSYAIANSYDSIEYNLSLAKIKNSVLKVEVIFTGKFKDKLVVDLPFKWAASVYTDQIKNIKLKQNYNMKLVNGKNGSEAIITITDVNNQITLSYEIHQKIGNPSDVHGTIIRDNLVHSTGYGLFAIPNDLKENEKIKVNINWLDIPEKWRTLSSYSSESSMHLNLRFMEILHGFYLVGNIRIYNVGDDANPVFLSLYGKFDMSDRKMLSDLSGILRSQKAFFNDYDFPYYAISLIEGDDPLAMGGTRLINSFTAFIPHKLKKNDYYILFAHENLHNWIGGKINNNKDGALNYWWTEGFTDYYCRLIALRSKGIDKATFITETNQILRDYYLSTFNTEPNSRIKKDFWNNYEIQKLPYYRGFVFAIYLNNMIQKENADNALDNMMQDLFKISKKKEFSSQLFKEIAGSYIPKGIDSEMSSFIDKGNIISLADVNLAIDKVIMGRYHLGFNKDIMIKEKMIKDIDVKSNAYNVGLRNGQKITSFSLPKGWGNANQIVTIKTTDSVFKFKPEHYNKTDVYQIKSNMSSKEKKQFNKFFAFPL